MGAVADMRIGVWLILYANQRREARQRRGVGEKLNVLDDVRTKLQIAARCVYARIVDDDREVARARYRQAAIGERELAVLTQAVDASQHTRLIQEVIKL